MSWYIYDSFNYYIRGGFKTKEAAEKYIFSNEYMRCYNWQYETAYWEDDYAYLVIDIEDSDEEHTFSGPIFHTWDDAWDYICEHTFYFGTENDWFALIRKIRM